MQFKRLCLLMLLFVPAGCGVDTSDPAAEGSGGVVGKFSSLLESGYTVEELAGELAAAGPKVAGTLKKRLELAIAECKEQLSGLQLDVQRFSSDALLSSKAREIRDALEARKAELSLLESKLAAVLKHTGLLESPGK